MGMARTFTCWPDFESGLGQFSSQTHQLFVRRTSTDVRKRNVQIKKRWTATASHRSKIMNLLPESFEFYNINCQCTHGPVRATKTTGQRFHNSVRTNDCPVKISATLTRLLSGQHIIKVRGSGYKHNHNVGSQIYRHYPQVRQISDEVLLDRVECMRQAGTKAKGVLLYLRENCDKSPTIKDVHNLLARLRSKNKRAGTDSICAEAVLRDLCNTDVGSIASLYVGDLKVLQTVVFQTRKMRRLFAAFPEVLMVDTTFNTNRNRYKLFSFVVHDIHGKGQYVQHALMTSESKACMQDAVASFVHYNQNWRSIKAVITDKDSKERDVLAAAFTTARLLLCQFHVISYFEKQVTTLCKGCPKEKQRLKDHVASLVYASSKLEYDRCKNLFLFHLGGDVNHPLYDYFLRNWDSTTDEWVSYQRSNVAHLGNNTNNRIEFKWAKLKYVIEPTFGMEECISTLLCLQDICEDEYEAELLKVGQRRFKTDEDGEEIPCDVTDELARLWNMVSSHAFRLVHDEVKFAYRRSTCYTVSVRDKVVAELLNSGDNHIYKIFLENFTCSCIFARTSLLPCRHTIYYRRMTASFNAHAFETIIPFKFINPRWCRATELNDISDAKLAVDNPVRIMAATKRNPPQSPRAKYCEAMDVMNDLAGIMQEMGMERFKETLTALSDFRNEAAAGRVPRFYYDPDLTGSNRLLAVETSNVNAESQWCASERTLQDSGHAVSQESSTSRDIAISGSSTDNQGSFTLLPATKFIEKSRRKQKRESRGETLNSIKKAATDMAHGAVMGNSKLSDIHTVLSQSYSLALCAPVFNSVRTEKLDSTDIAVIDDEEFDVDDFAFVLDKHGVDQCVRAIRSFQQKHALLILDVDKRVCLTLDTRHGKFTATRIKTLVNYYDAVVALKKIKQAMDWIDTLETVIPQNVLPQLSEYVHKHARQHVQALRYYKIKNTRIEGHPVEGVKLLKFCGDTWLNDECILAGMLHIHRPNKSVGIVNPLFSQLSDPEARRKVAASLGAFDDGSAVVAGVIHATKAHWTAFIYYREGVTVEDEIRPTCILYDRGSTAYQQTKLLVQEIISPSVPADIVFIEDSLPKCADGVNCGVLALLFLEVHLYKAPRWDRKVFENPAWDTNMYKSLNYYRLRFLLKAIEMSE